MNCLEKLDYGMFITSGYDYQMMGGRSMDIIYFSDAVNNTPTCAAVWSPSTPRYFAAILFGDTLQPRVSLFRRAPITNKIIANFLKYFRICLMEK